MKRSVSLNEISDGRLYDVNDMVKADCNDCIDCFDCCKNMGNSIILDPLDIYQLTTGLKLSFQKLLEEKIQLHVVDGIILPNLNMDTPEEKCVFLDIKGRCSIYDHRPGICRIFPLGRYYENKNFKYFLQIHECKKGNRTKIKVHKWIAIHDFKKNQTFIKDWHYFLEDIEEKIKSMSDENQIKEWNMKILTHFFVTPYLEEDFYEQFYKRLETFNLYKQEALNEPKRSN